MTTELTRSPQVNKLLSSIQSYLEGGFQDESLAASFQETLVFFDALGMTFESQLKITPSTATLEKETPLLRAALTGMKEKLAAVRQAIDAQQMETLRQAAANLKDTTARLFEVFDRMQAAEAKEPNVSRSPYLNQVMKVGTAVTDGKMDPEILRAMLTQLIAHHNQSTPFVNAPPSATPEQKSGLFAALRQYLEGLQEAERYFEDNDTAHIMKGLGHSDEATEKLYALEEAFAQAEAASRIRHCMRCGAENEVQARACGKCHAVLPQTIDSGPGAPTVDVHVEEEIRTTGHVMTETTQALVNMVMSIQSGQRIIYELKGTLQTLEERMKSTWAQLHEVDPATMSKTDEDRQAMEWARETMKVALTEMADGVNSMYRAINAHNPANLDVGMEAFLVGADKMASVQQAAVTFAQTGAAPI